MRVKKQSAKTKRIAKKTKQSLCEKSETVSDSKPPAKRGYEATRQRKQYQDDDVKEAKRARMSKQYADNECYQEKCKAEKQLRYRTDKDFKACAIAKSISKYASCRSTQ